MKNTRSKSSNSSISLAAVLRAVQECRIKPLGDPQRIIVLLTPAEFGLPLPYLQELRQRGAVVVQAGQLELSRLRFLKMLANRTRVVPLLLAGAEFWRNWNKRRAIESAQIRRRTHLVLQLDACSE